MRIVDQVYDRHTKNGSININGVVTLLTVAMVVIIVWALLRCAVLALSLHKLTTTYSEEEVGDSASSLLERTLGPLSVKSMASR